MKRLFLCTLLILMMVVVVQTTAIASTFDDTTKKVDVDSGGTQYNDPLAQNLFGSDGPFGVTTTSSSDAVTDEVEQKEDEKPADTVIEETPANETIATATVATNAPTSVTVKEGDSLSAIARRVYGDASRYHEIIEANKDKYPSLLKNPDLIHPDWELIIPPDTKEVAQADTTPAQTPEVTENVETSSPAAEVSQIPSLSTIEKQVRIQKVVYAANKAVGASGKRIEAITPSVVDLLVKKGFMTKEEWMAMNPPIGYRWEVDKQGVVVLKSDDGKEVTTKEIDAIDEKAKTAEKEAAKEKAENDKAASEKAAKEKKEKDIKKREAYDRATIVKLEAAVKRYNKDHAVMMDELDIGRLVEGRYLKEAPKLGFKDTDFRGSNLTQGGKIWNVRISSDPNDPKATDKAKQDIKDEKAQAAKDKEEKAKAAKEKKEAAEKAEAKVKAEKEEKAAIEKAKIDAEKAANAKYHKMLSDMGMPDLTANSRDYNSAISAGSKFLSKGVFGGVTSFNKFYNCHNYPDYNMADLQAQLKSAQQRYQKAVESKKTSKFLGMFGDTIESTSKLVLQKEAKLKERWAELKKAIDESHSKAKELEAKVANANLAKSRLEKELAKLDSYDASNGNKIQAFNEAIKKLDEANEDDNKKLGYYKTMIRTFK